MSTALSQSEIDRVLPGDDASSFRAFGEAVALAGRTLAGNPTQHGMRTFLRALSMLMEELETDLAAHRNGARGRSQDGGGAC